LPGNTLNGAMMALYLELSLWLLQIMGRFLSSSSRNHGIGTTIWDRNGVVIDITKGWWKKRNSSIRVNFNDGT